MATPVLVPCPRCGGQGHNPNWRPSQGVCYLCRGRASIEVDIDLAERHLAYLRGQYVQARKAKDEFRMKYIEEKGIQKRDLLELAKAHAS